jgi:hypothetical protein
LFFYFEKKAEVTAEPPAPQYHVGCFLFCPPVSKQETPKAINSGPRLKILLKAHFKNAPPQGFWLGR